MFLYGVCLEQGVGDHEDLGSAQLWHEKAAALGETNAMHRLGDWELAPGHDKAAAGGWYEKAAELGDAGAMCRLGLCYTLGWGGFPGCGDGCIMMSQSSAVGLYRRHGRSRAFRPKRLRRGGRRARCRNMVLEGGRLGLNLGCPFAQGLVGVRPAGKHWRTHRAGPDPCGG
jgi:hypothetical protein